MKLLDFFREHNDEIIDLLKELVVRESPTTDKRAVDTLGAFVAEQVSQDGGLFMAYQGNIYGYFRELFFDFRERLSQIDNGYGYDSLAGNQGRP